MNGLRKEMAIGLAGVVLLAGVPSWAEDQVIVPQGSGTPVGMIDAVMTPQQAQAVPQMNQAMLMAMQAQVAALNTPVPQPITPLVIPSVTPTPIPGPMSGFDPMTILGPQFASAMAGVNSAIAMGQMALTMPMTGGSSSSSGDVLSDYNPFLLSANAAPAPAAQAANPQGVVIGSTTPAQIQTNLRNQIATYQAQRVAFQTAKERLEATLQGMRDRGMDAVPGPNATNQQRFQNNIYLYNQAMLTYVNNSMSRWQRLIDIANAPPAQAAPMIRAFNTVMITALQGRIALIQNAVTALQNQINGLQAGPRRDFLQTQLGLAQGELAGLRQDLANSRATDQAGGIVLVDPYQRPVAPQPPPPPMGGN